MKKRTRLWALLLACSLVFQFSNNVYAADAEPIDTTVCPENVENPEQRAYDMRIDSNEWKNWPEGPKTHGEAGIVMDVETGAILYAKNIDGKAYPASITKVATLLIALENGKLDDMVKISEDAVYSVTPGYAHIALKPGEEITLKDTLYAVMLASANDAAYAVAENVGESYEWFIDEMNRRTRELGGRDTHFNNTNGMEDENHYTSARDMALITRELLLHHPEFEEICQTYQYTIPTTNLTNETRTFQQKHRMFRKSNKHYYENVIAGKTGYTDVAKNTLISCAEKDGRKLVCVVLKTHGSNVYEDSEALLEYGFNSFEKVPLEKKRLGDDIKSVKDGSYMLVPKGVKMDSISKKIVQDEENPKKGNLIYEYDGHELGNTDVELSKEYVKEHVPKPLGRDDNYEAEEGKKEIPLWAKIIMIVLLLLIVIVMVWILIIIHLRKKRIEKRRRIQEKRRKEMLRQRHVNDMDMHRNVDLYNRKNDVNRRNNRRPRKRT